MAVTTADIARRTGLSKMTVSRVLNNHPYVRPETREKVLSAMKEMGFRPNTLARRFFTGKTQLIGVVIPLEFMFSTFYFKELFQGIMEYLEEREYDIILHNSKSAKIPPAEKCISLVKGKLVEGLLVAAPMSYDHYPYELTKEEVPLVVMGEQLHADEVNRVGIANRQSAREATEYLLRQGHRKIGVMHFGSEQIESVERLQGYKDALKKAGIKYDDALVGEAEFTRAKGFEETRRILEEQPDITAIFSLNVDMTLGAADALRGLGKRIPQDVSLVSFDDSVELESHDPPITAVRQFPYRVGLAATQMLLGILEAGAVPSKPQCTLIPTQFMERASVSAPLAPGRSG